MRKPLWDRIQEWWCSMFGHRMENKPWHHNDHRHDVCLRCMAIISTEEEDPSLAAGGEG